ncbi:MAG: hypothetical protein KU37_06660 [Sulfuricurvum sp. PC08-66]|nr:MAG: hypothetical protein KU37_06660 [Sulfuricurvum sp. PC08-66]
MTTKIYLNTTFQEYLSTFDTSETLILSTQNLRYKSMQNARVFQVRTADIFDRAIGDFYASDIILDLFDDLARTIPEALGAFLDDYEAGIFQTTQLHIVVKERSLIEKWELYDVLDMG